MHSPIGERRTSNIRLIEILMVCTGNTCRSPMAAAFLSRQFEDAGVEAVVSSTGILFEGKPATDHGVAVMADRGIDTSRHRSRKLRAEMVAGADLVIGMAREHVAEALAFGSDIWERAFTFKEIVRLGEEHGGREPGEPLEQWLARLHEARLRDGRRPTDLFTPSGDDDIPARSAGRAAATSAPPRNSTISPPGWPGSWERTDLTNRADGVRSVPSS